MFRLLDAALREDDSKLVPADAARDVRRPDHLAHALGRFREDGVAREMADPVVHCLEVVDVEDDQREPAVIAVGARAFAAERLVEVASVVEAGGRVEVGGVSRLPETAGGFACPGGPGGARPRAPGAGLAPTPPPLGRGGP